MKIVFMLEEYSMKCVLDELLPRILPEGIFFETIPHNGKIDLRRSLPRKLRGWNEPGVRFVVLQDQDDSDCHKVKNELATICANAGRNDTLVRIVCHELEAWYFGDIQALAKAYPDSISISLAEKESYRVPDNIRDCKERLIKLIPTHGQISGAKRIAPLMEIEQNTSASFQCFVRGVRQLVASG